MLGSFETFIEEARPYIEACHKFTKRHAIEDKVVLDHICFKCASSVDYDRKRMLLEGSPPSVFLYQVQLSGRRVAYVGLATRLSIGEGGSVNCIELADRKPGLSEQAGFHHIEIYPVGITYHNLVSLLQAGGETVVLKQRPHHTTHDIALPDGFIIRLTDMPLIRKILEREFVAVK